MLAENHSIIRAKTRFSDVEIIKFLLEFITLVLSANIIGSEMEFIAMEGHLYKPKRVRDLK